MRVLATQRAHLATLPVSPGLVATAVTAGDGGGPSPTFTETGHRIYNRAEHVAFHVAPGMRQVEVDRHLVDLGHDDRHLLPGTTDTVQAGQVNGNGTSYVDTASVTPPPG